MSRFRFRRPETEDAEFLDKTTAAKLFSFLLCHGEDCQLELSVAVKRLQSFTGGSIAEEKALNLIKSFREMFEVKTVDGKKFVEAKTSVKLCDAFQNTNCRSPTCKQLHICRFFLQSSCKFGDKCQKPHSFDSFTTRRLLLNHNLATNLPRESLRSLFKKVLNVKKIRHASTTSGPGPCKFYNKGECKNGDKCEFLHVCEHYVKGDCKFGEKKCKRSHHFGTSHSRKVLASHNLGNLRNERQILSFLTSASETESLSSRKRGRQFESEDDGSAKKVKSETPSTSARSNDSTTSEIEICGFNLRGKCQYGEKCNARHTNLPYEWQYSYCSPNSVSWSSFTSKENCGIEKSFCNCEEDVGSAKSNGRLLPISIDFQAMKGELEDQQNQQSDCDVKDTGTQVQIRRLSTISSVLAATGHVFRTKWKWYWKDEHDKWQSYDNEKTSTSSEKIEQQYQSDPTEKKHQFSTSSSKYTLYFDNPNQLYQQNDVIGTKRDVRRRPDQFWDENIMKQVLQKFKSEKIKCQRLTFSNKSETELSVPTSWTPLVPSEEFNLVDLSEVGEHREEFTKVKTLFLATMVGHTVKSIKRVQNAGLWEDYQRQKSRMTKRNSGFLPEERLLFHGTSKETVNPICQQGFDWRLSGKHGTMYGKGSYFATEASYSHTYTQHGSGGHSRMFLAKVIVGSFVVGNQNMQRPPPKNPLDPLSVLHDSCANNVIKPTIFVVFERSQAYPNYIIDY